MMPQIPLIDLRQSGPLALLETHAASALALIKASRKAFGPWVYAASYGAAPLGDAFVRRWLEKTGNPYKEEIAGFARHLKASGIHALNLSYEFACTSGVYATKDGPRLLRVLDWPIRGLGAHLIVAHQRGEAGDFHNATWPAVSGVYTAMAKGRFAAALNQAPMRRHKSGIPLDWLKNRRMVWKARGLPPAHLLRKACETAASYEEAKRMLAETPVALPVIYILAGTKDSEGCVIERLEEAAAVREIVTSHQVNAANHFLSHINGIGYGWRPREVDSCGRAICANSITLEEAGNPSMPWYRPPISNHNSRLRLSANAATGKMSLQGVEGPLPVTELFELL